MSNIVFHSPEGIKADELFTALSLEFNNIQKSSLNTAIEEQDTLIIAFPDQIILDKSNQEKIISEILSNTFLQIQKFVQARMKKKFGQIICLIDSSANGLNYNKQINACFTASQAGLIGMIKTLTKEYSKRGIISNVLYIDWESINPSEVVKLAKSLLSGHPQLRGQIFALDGGRWL